MNYTPQRIIYNGAATIVFWQDGSKTVVKCAEGTKPDKYNAFCAALAKKVYGSNTKLKKCIREAEYPQELKVGDRVIILDGSKIPDYAGSWAMPEMVGKKATIFGIYLNGLKRFKAVNICRHLN